MGKIFTWEDVKFDNIPLKESYDTVASLLNKKLGESSSIKGAVICGSYPRGDFNIRSDIDCLVIYDNLKQNEARSVFKDLLVNAYTYHVPLELIPLDIRIANTTNHFITPSFVNFIKMSHKYNTVIKDDPLLFIRPVRISTLEDTRLYISNKIRKLEKRIHSVDNPSTTEEAKHKLLQKALELPFNVARKILQCYDTEFPVDDSKSEVLRLYNKLPNFSKSYIMLSRIHILNLQYDITLDICRETLHKDKYTKKIDEITNVLYPLLDWTKSTLLKLN